MNIIFWQDIISPHQYSYIKEIKNIKKDWNVVLIVQELLTTDREQLGWGVPKVETEFEIVLGSDVSRINSYIDKTNSVHIISGLRGPKHIRFALRKLFSKKSVVFIMSESVEAFPKIKYFARIILSIFFERKFRNSIKGVLCIGENAKRWYIKCGFKKEMLFDFLYVVEKNPYQNLTTNTDNSPKKKFVAIGQLIKRKGFQLLIKSLAGINSDNWTLDIIGDGPYRGKLNELIIENGLSDRIFLKGVVPNEKIKAELVKYDASFQPSYFDGWNATINESLMAGTPVFCSKQCGGATLVHSSDLGETFDIRNRKQLHNLLKGLIDNFARKYDRQSIKDWAHTHINGKVVAKYFVDIITYSTEDIKDKPTAPWKS